MPETPTEGESLYDYFLRVLRTGTKEERQAVKRDPRYLGTMYGMGPLKLKELIERADD